MIFDEEKLQSILKGKTTTARLPVRYYRDISAIKRCPVRAGRSYKLRVRVPATDDQPAQIKSTAHWVHVLTVDRNDTEWVVTFQHGQVSPPRLLSAKQPAVKPDDSGDPQADHARGYTSNAALAIDNGGESVDDDTLDRYAYENGQDRIRRIFDYEHTRREMALEDRLAAVREAARAQGIDLRRQEASVASRIAAMERLVQRKAAA